MPETNQRMKFCTCNSSPGLDRYPVDARFRVWRDAHKQLMGTDPAYRKTVKRYFFRTCTSSVLTTSLILAFSFSIQFLTHNAAVLIAS